MLEIERKYDADEDVVVPDLSGISGVASVAGPEEERLSATYVDTADRALLAAGITLRRRLGGHDEGWHLKLPAVGAEDERHELRLPAGRSSARVPQRFRTTLTTLVGDRRLAPVATVDTRRVRRRLLDAEGRCLAEVVDDRVEASTTGAGEALVWRELEVELDEGDRAVLDRAERRLLAAGARVAEHATKLARVLGDAAPVTPEPVRGHDPVARLLRVRLDAQVRELVLRDPLARENLPEGVHAMRVATRRLRSALATGRPFLDPTVSEPLRQEIAWLADLLGAARDAEVMRERLEAAITAGADDGLAPAGDPGVRRALLAPLERRHRRAIADLHSGLRSDRYPGLLQRLRAVTEDPPWTSRAEQTVRDGYRRRVAHDLDRLERFVLAAEQESQDAGTRSTTLHAARRATKRARYAVEPLREVYPGPAEALVKTLKSLQTALGDRQDTAVTCAYLLGLTEPGHRPSLPPAAALVAGVLVERERLAGARYEEDAASAWAQVVEHAAPFRL